jgi:Uncharacterised nucleotidyltransferase
MMFATPTGEALLACIKLYLNTIAKDEAKRALTAQIDWTGLLTMAIKAGMLPLLYEACKQLDSDLFPKDFRLKLQTHYRMHALYNLSQAKELLKILDRLKQAGIEVIAFKGPVLAVLAYKNIAFRQFHDLDILVKPQDFDQARSLLRKLGYDIHFLAGNMSYERYLQLPLAQINPESVMFHQRFEQSFLHSNKERGLDLHWGIPPRRVWDIKRFEQLWLDQHPVELLGQRVFTFSIEITLVVQCINATKDPWTPSFKKICDIGQIIQAYPDLDWAGAMAIAKKLGSQKLFLIGLGLTHNLLNVPLPSNIAKQVLNRNLQRLVQQIETVPQSRGEKEIIPRIGMLWWWEYQHQLRTLDKLWDLIWVTWHYLGLGLIPFYRRIRARSIKAYRSILLSQRESTS